MRYLYLTATLLAAASFAACGEEEPPVMTTEEPLQCKSAGYTAFDPQNHANQDLRVSAYEQMLVSIGEAQADPTLANAKFTEAQALYENTAELRTKVMGRKDDHFDPPADVGPAIDGVIMDGFTRGKAATTALEVNLAKQAIDKTMIRFFFVSVYHELVDGSRLHWDEAYGYYGSGPDITGGERKGFSKVASRRDTTNGTALTAEIFNGIVDGSCELAKALRDQSTDKIDWKAVAPVKAMIEQIDEGMQKVLAYSVGHEAFEIDEIQEMLRAAPTPELRGEMEVKFAELEYYWAAIEPMMTLRGGESATRAQRIEGIVEAVRADTTDGWMETMDAAAIMTDLEAEYSIDIRG